MGGPAGKPVKPTPSQAQEEKGAVADTVAVVVIEDGVLSEVKTNAQPKKKTSWSKRIAGGVVTIGTIVLGALFKGGKDASPTTPTEDVVPSALYPSTTSLFPENARYRPTKKELKSEEGNFRLNFSPYPELEKGQGNYYMADTDIDGSYVFQYDEALGNKLVAEGYAPYCLWFTLTDREGVVTKIDHAPSGDGVASTSGHFYESDKTKSEKGKYLMYQGEALVGKGTYYYYRIAGKARGGTSRATYSDATFYYLYFADKFYVTADMTILPSTSADEVAATTPPALDSEAASASAPAVDDEPAATTPVTVSTPPAATPIAPAAVSAAAIPPPVTTLGSTAAYPATASGNEEPPAPAEPEKMTMMEQLPIAVLLPVAPTPEPTSIPSPSFPPSLLPSSMPTRAPSSLALTKQPTIAFSYPPTTMATAAATMVQYMPTDEELSSPLGNYRLHYAQSNNWEPGGWYFLDQKSSIEGKYTFYYDDPQAVAPGEKYVYHYIYKSPRAIEGQISIKYAPIGQSASASGLLHKGGIPGMGLVGGGDYTTSEKGKYYLQEGSHWESGTYYYYRIPGKKTGRDGYLSESTFYYLYFPSSHSTASRKAGFRL